VQISQAFQTFGLNSDTSALIAIKVAVAGNPTAESVQKHLEASVDGTPVALQDEVLSGFTDLAKVRKIYKLESGAPGGKKGKAGETGMALNGNAAEERREMEAVVVGSMALRGL
jgi:EKC/KEOPS complex subunit CGI121/TPRKB